MQRTEGTREIAVGVIDGPVRLDHPALSGQSIRELSGGAPAACRQRESFACAHGTLVIGVLAARRGSGAPAICPGCTFLLRPIFPENITGGDPMPVSTPEELATAIIDSVSAGARVINLSAALTEPSTRGENRLAEALDFAARRGVLVTAAAGNQGTVGGSALTRHPWVIPVIGCDVQGRPMQESNLGGSIGRHGLAAPGENITSTGADGRPGTFGGTSAAAPFVTGAIALLWSEFPRASAGQIKLVVTQAARGARRTIVPPLLDAWGAYLAMGRN